MRAAGMIVGLFISVGRNATAVAVLRPVELLPPPPLGTRR